MSNFRHEFNFGITNLRFKALDFKIVFPAEQFSISALKICLRCQNFVLTSTLREKIRQVRRDIFNGGGGSRTPDLTGMNRTL